MKLEVIVVIVSPENMTDARYEAGLTLVDQESQERIKRFYHRADSYRCLAGRLLPRLLLLRLGIPLRGFRFSRTKAGKPFVETFGLGHLVGFNISHDQSVVIMASQTVEATHRHPTANRHALPGHRILPQSLPVVQNPVEQNTADLSMHDSPTADSILLIGVDVMKIAYPRFAKDLRAFVSTVEDTLTPGEKLFLQSFYSSGHSDFTQRPDIHGTNVELQREREGLRYLFLMWTLKEAYTKALGLGFGFDFRRIECKVTLQDSAEDSVTIQVDGMDLRGWEFLTWRMQPTDNGDEIYQIALARRIGEKAADQPEPLGRVTDRGLLAHHAALDDGLKINSAHDLPSGMDGHSAASTSADNDGQQQPFGPSSVGAGAEDTAAVPSLERDAEVEEKQGTSGLYYEDHDLRIELYDALAVINMVSALSSDPGSIP